MGRQNRGYRHCNGGARSWRHPGGAAKGSRFFDELFQGLDCIIISAFFAKRGDVQHELAGGLAIGHLPGKFDFVFERFVTAVVFSPVEGKNLIGDVAVDEIGVAAPVKIVAQEKRFPGCLVVFSGEMIGVCFAGIDKSGGAVLRDGGLLLWKWDWRGLRFLLQ